LQEDSKLEEEKPGAEGETVAIEENVEKSDASIETTLETENTIKENEQNENEVDEIEEYREKPQENAKLSWLERLKLGLTKTRESFTKKIKDLVSRKHEIDEDFKEELEEILISTDLGVKAMEKIMYHFEEIAQMERIEDHEELLELLKEIFYVILDEEPVPLKINPNGLTVIMMVGVNGTGKTTTIGKLAQKFKNEGKNVMVVAGDTFRAAAIEQLETWARRVGCDIVKHQAGADAAAVVFDGVKAAVARGKDVLLVDTAGRLHTKSNLMEELKKVKRVIQKVMPDAPHETILVLDSTTGQNGINQAKIFNQEIGVSGLILTKLDGTAKGGVVVAIKEELKLPVKYIGVGEKVEDLHTFSPQEFVEALLS
jgi:fused signal recognition particle receptor